MDRGGWFLAGSFTISSAEARASVQKGFRGLWPVPRHVIVRGGLIYPGRQRRDLYAPAAHREIAQKFARLADASDAEIVRFVGLWGHLGYSRLSATPDMTQREADPIDWIRAHARGVKTCFELLEHLDPLNKRHEMLREYVNSHSAMTPQGRRISPAVVSGIRDQIRIVGVSPGQTESTHARNWVIKLINDNISGISMGVGRILPDRGFEVQYQFTALIEMVWWQVLNVAKGHGRITRCLACGSPFEQTHGRQKYCPPSMRSKESTCGRSHRARAQRHRTS